MTNPLTTCQLRSPHKGQSKVIAIFSYRHDAQLVPALLKNIAPFVHGYAAWNDNVALSMRLNEPERRNRLNQVAKEMGADWILALDPDERFEPALAMRMEDLTLKRNAQTLWVFQLREMYSPTAWRSDGIWGRKTQTRLYPVQAVTDFLDKPLHGPWVVGVPGFVQRPTFLNLYHLRHATPERTQLRRDTYAAADPQRLFHPIGYDYLVDLRGATFTEIPPGREYFPTHVEDGTSWAAETPKEMPNLARDPLPTKLKYISFSLRSQGATGAYFTARDLLQCDPADSDIALAAASYALTSGRPEDAIKLALPFARKGSDDLFALSVVARAQAQAGDDQQARSTLGQMSALRPDSRWVRHLATSLFPTDAQFAVHSSESWTCWTQGKGECLEGTSNGKGALAVVIIGFRAQAGLLKAVRSIRNQSKDAEIVVVNSGGGPVAKILHDHLDQVRLINVQKPLQVGAARNIGIDASAAPFIAFLAGDCEALPGWVDARTKLHAAGSLSVSSPVASSTPGHLSGSLYQFLRYRRRKPDTRPEDVAHFGRSYLRRVFLEVGYFSTGLSFGEDDEFNQRLDLIAQPVWAPDVVTRHADPTSVTGVIIDAFRRARRWGRHLGASPFSIKDVLTFPLSRRVSLYTSATGAIPEEVVAKGRFRVQLFRIFLKLSALALRMGFRLALLELMRANRAAREAEALIKSDPSGAVKKAQKAVRLAPQEERYHRLLGRALLAANKTDKKRDAFRHFRTAMDLAPARADALIQMKHVRHGRSLSAIAENAVIAAPASCPVLLAAAEVLLKTDDRSLALAFARAALAANPSSPQVHSLLASIHALSAEPELARRRREMADALRANPKASLG